jgi:hypothetical protein
LEDGGFIQPILELPSLDLEHRDPQRRTLILSACRSSLGADASLDSIMKDVKGDVDRGYSHDSFADPNAITPLKYLLSRGANPLAQDKWGKNCLLQLLEAHDSLTLDSCRSRPPIIRRSLQHMATNYPELVKQHDYYGTYPLHAAL